MFKLKKFQAIHDLFPREERHLLFNIRQQVQFTKPYNGLKVLLNIPLTKSTLLVVDILCLGGANLTVSNSTIIEPDMAAVEILTRAGIDVRLDHNFQDDYDVCLDCCGELYGKISPRLGSAELTRTGAMLYKQKELTYPVISVDDSELKKFETLYGTGDGFLRAFKQLATKIFSQEKFVIFGYGKVGEGVVAALQEHTQNIVIIELNKERLQAAETKGHQIISADNYSLVEKTVRGAFAIVTATGVQNIISENYNTQIFKQGQYLANIGAEDEFGEHFSTEEVLNAKRPINFALEEPTKMKFLDPVFSALISTIDELKAGKYTPGLHEFPRELDEYYINEWHKFYDQPENQKTMTMSP